MNEQQPATEQQNVNVDPRVMPALLPCPFCGGPAEISESPSLRKPYKLVLIICKNLCDSMAGDWWDKESLGAAIKDWNTRSGEYKLRDGIIMAMQHLYTNYDADGRSMVGSDAYKALADCLKA